LKQAAQSEQIELYYLDESGFAPTLPLGYTWAREGTRPLVLYEAPQGRRINVVGALAPFGSNPRLVYRSRAGKIDSSVLLSFLWHDLAGMTTPVGQVPENYQAGRLRVIVMDNYSVHRSQEVKAQLAALQAIGMVFFYLPPYCPDLNRIEGVWRHTKYEDMPIRSHPTAEALKQAVDAALAKRACSIAETASGEADRSSKAPVDCVSVVSHSTNYLRKAA
jgi:hypothetical protein